MQKKDGFHRMTIDQMKALKEEKELQKVTSQLMGELDERINEEAEKLAQELVDDGIDVDSFHIEVDVQAEGDKLVVRYNVVQEAKVLVITPEEKS